MQLLTTSDTESAFDALRLEIVRLLEMDKSVLWLLSGGSNIQASVNILNQLPESLTAKLSTSLIDERYGSIGHPDSNAQQLIEAGFDIKKAHFVPVLYSSLDMVETAKQFEVFLQQAIRDHTVLIGQLGIGDDGHISGIKPKSPAIEATGLTAAYDWEDYRRITTTFAALQLLDSSFTFVWGENKRAMLERLQNEAPALNEQPAQILKSMANAYLYTDQSI